MTGELQDLLVSGLNSIGLPADHLLPKIKLYYSELLLWNPKLGLIEADERGIILKHILDCAAAVPVFLRKADEIIQGRELDREGDPLCVADLGSGSGLPGLILALAMMNSLALEVHLVEKQQRRCGFLRNIVPILGLDSIVSIHQKKIEDVTPSSFDMVTSRAFRNLTPEQLAVQRRLLRPGGYVIAYKGRMETIRSEMGAEFEYADIIPLKVPGLDDERHLVVTARGL